MSYIPKQEKLARERVEVKLDTRLVEQLNRYCVYLDSDRDYVIAQALEIVFRKDKGFADWLAQNPEASGSFEAGLPGKRRRAAADEIAS